MENRNYLFEVIGEDSELCGEQFFVQIDPETTKNPVKQAWETARENFEGETLKLVGVFSDESAEWIGLDTY